ncbi:PX domain-containing protein ypt35 [Neopestalotiopsis sp. 37M]|nr:PX domain-containing protein ypt35 [Neopestalotiopsis sp. 37M]
MASEVTAAPCNGGGGSVAAGGALGPRKILTSSSIETPPSPPATETDTETDSETSQRDHSSDDGGRSGAPVSATTEGEQEQDAPVISPVTSPPYWYQTHARSPSRASDQESMIGAIVMRDNESSSIDERNHACWAKSVEITDHVIVNGSATNIGAFVVWNIRVETLSGSYMNIRKRYSEFDDLRWRLVRTFPNFEAAVPELPPKSLISKFRPRFLEKRRAGLQYFLNCIMLNPEFSGSPVLKEFLFS